jgi:hypothetical protein
MSNFLHTIFLKYIYLVSNIIPKNFLSHNNRFIKSSGLFDTVEYKSEYKGDNLGFFFLPLMINISQISIDIKKTIFNKNVVCITSILIFHEMNSDAKYTQSLSDSNNLYSLEYFDKWPTTIFLNIIEKLESYKSFKKISLVIQVRAITNV